MGLSPGARLELLIARNAGARHPKKTPSVFLGTPIGAADMRTGCTAAVAFCRHSREEAAWPPSS
jgi:hypothetical protein